MTVERVPNPWWVTVLYAVLVLAAASLAMLLLGDLIATLESGGEHAEDGGGELHHLFIFDLAWPVFLVTSTVTLLGGLAAGVISRVRRTAYLTRYAAWALGYSALAVVVIWATGSL